MEALLDWVWIGDGTGHLECGRQWRKIPGRKIRRKKWGKRSSRVMWRKIQRSSLMWKKTWQSNVEEIAGRKI